MSFQTPITISEAIENIDNNRYLLPSIQREFEWEHTKNSLNEQEYIHTV